MSYFNEQNQMQSSKYEQFAHDLLKAAGIYGSKVVLRRSLDASTELLNELGTTDMAIGDVTAEVMITTLGKIPSEMYYLEDTTSNARITVHGGDLDGTSKKMNSVTTSTELVGSNNKLTSHSTVLLTLLIVLLAILLLCCITACLIAWSKKRGNIFRKQDIECEPGCGGINQPLLGTGKISDTTSKTSSGSPKN